MKKILAIATLAVGALAAPAASLVTPATAGAAGGAAPRATPKACTTKQLVTYLTGANGAAGTTYYTLNFTNLGGTCTLHGYPGVSAVSRSGRILGGAARRQKGKAKTVTLRAAKVGNPSSATVTLAVVQALNFPAAKCHPVNAAGLRVYPPNQRASETIPLPFTACSRRGPIYLKIGAVK